MYSGEHPAMAIRLCIKLFALALLSIALTSCGCLSDDGCSSSSSRLTRVTCYSGGTEIYRGTHPRRSVSFSRVHTNVIIKENGLTKMFTEGCVIEQVGI